MKSISDLLTKGMNNKAHPVTLLGMLGCELTVLFFKAVINFLIILWLYLKGEEI